MIHLKYKQPVVACGTRNGLPDTSVYSALYSYDAEIDYIDHLVVGSRIGVDGQAFTWALTYQRIVTIVSAEWNQFGNRAGPMRNDWMGRYFKPRAVLAFPGGKGTLHMIGVGLKYEVPVWHYEANQNGGFEKWRLDERCKLVG